MTANLGPASVQCVAEGGRPEPQVRVVKTIIIRMMMTLTQTVMLLISQVSLFSGDRNITMEGGGGRFCRAARDTVCVQFELDITANMSGGSLRCTLVVCYILK